MLRLTTRMYKVTPWFVFTVSLLFGSLQYAAAQPWMTVNGAYADYLTLHYYINETNDTETVYVDFWPNEANVEAAQVWGNLNRRQYATLGDQDYASYPGPSPSGTNYFVGFPMTRGDGGKWYAALPIQKTGAYRITCRYKVTGDPKWRWFGKRDTAIMVSPKKARDVILYELQVNVINATGDDFNSRSTFEDLHNPSKPANLDYFTNMGVNTLWIQPIHPIGSHYCVSATPGSPYSIQNMWEVAPHHSQGNTRPASMAAFTNYAAAARAKGIDFFFDIIFNHTSWDAEIGRDPNNPSQPASNPTALIKNMVPQWYSRYVSTYLPCDEYGYNQNDFHYWLPARHANELGPAPAERNDFGKWPDVADLFWGTYPALFNPQTDSDTYWDVNQQGADVRRMVEYFAYFGQYWVEKSGGTLGGFRCDYAQGIPPQAWEYIVNKTRQVKWDFIFMAESLDGGNVSKRAGRHMDIINQNWVWQVLGSGHNTTGLRSIIDANKTDYGYAGIMRGLVNHDQNAPDDVWYTYSRYAVGAVVDGAPQLYQGQELGYRNNYGFSRFRFQFGRWIPNIFVWHNMQTLWNNRIGILENAYKRVNQARQRNIALRLHNQWYLDRTGGLGPHQQIFSVLKYEKFGWDPAHQNVVLAFVNLTPWTAQSGTFNLANVQAIYLNPTRYYNVKNLAADNPNAYLWPAPGKTGQELINGGVYVEFPADGNAYPDRAFVQVLKLEEHGGGGGGGTSAVQWVGNTYHSPANGFIGPTSNIVVRTESYPTGAAVAGSVIFSADGGSTWIATQLVKGAISGQNDTWSVGLGSFPACAAIRYAVVLRDANTNEVWDNNNNNDFFAYVNCTTLSLHSVTHNPANGGITPFTPIGIYVETAPSNEARSVAMVYQVNGGAWTSAPLAYGGTGAGPHGDRDWWSGSIGPFPACATVRYAVAARDVSSNQYWANNNGKDYYAYVNCVDLVITNPPADLFVSNNITSYTLQGICYGAVAGLLRWTNATTGQSGSGAVSSFWTFANISLATGANVITVSGVYTAPTTAVVAHDSPTNAAYSNAWNNGSNGGTGFGPWNLTAGPNAGWFRATPQNDGTNMSVGFVGWGTWANTDSAVDALRPFSSHLQVGDVFRLMWDNNWVNENPQGSVGFALLNSATNARFEFMFIGGGTNYVINDAVSGRHTGIPWTGDGLDIRFTLTGTNTYRLEVGSFAITGTLAQAGTPIAILKVWNWRAGPGWQYNLYLGEMSVTRSSVMTNTLSDAVTITREAVQEFVDSDGDGLPNWWEIENFGGPTNAVATEDSDGDGMNNYEEYISGTDPNGATSYLRLVPGSAVSAGYVVTWPSASNRVYQLHRSTNLLDIAGGFGMVATNLTATPPMNIYTDTTVGVEGPYFYRVQAELP